MLLLFRHLSEKYKTVAVFLVKIYYFLIVCFFFYFGNLDIFSHMLIFAIKAFPLIWAVLTFAKFVQFLKRSTVKGGRYFLIFLPRDMHTSYLNLKESQPIYAYNAFEMLFESRSSLFMKG